MTWGRLLPKLAVIIIFQEVPLADSADKWVSKSLIIPIFKNAHSGKTNNREKILLPLPFLQAELDKLLLLGRETLELFPTSPLGHECVVEKACSSSFF